MRAMRSLAEGGTPATVLVELRSLAKENACLAEASAYFVAVNQN